VFLLFRFEEGVGGYGLHDIQEAFEAVQKIISAQNPKDCLVSVSEAQL